VSVLVTGGAGYIGSHVVLALKDAGLTPVVIDDLSTGSAEAVPAGVPFILGNVGNASVIERAVSEHRVSAVMHFAGSVIVPDSFVDPLRYYHNNTVVSHALIATCLRLGVKDVVFSSTAAVYGEPESLPVGEDAAIRPVSPYGRSKFMTEEMIRDAGRASGLRFVILRYFNVAGADLAGRAGIRTPQATHLIKVACDVALGRRAALAIYGIDYPTPDGTGVRDYIHVSDLADAHVLALRHLASGGGSCTLNCGYGHGYSVRQVIAAIERVSGKTLPTTVEARRPGDSSAVVANSELLRRTLGWVPRYDDIDTIVRSSLEWDRR
jgi:UDP-glucose 4-epimerase